MKTLLTLALLVTTTTLHAAPKQIAQTLRDEQLEQQEIDAWCYDMIEQQHLTDSVVYICFDDEGNIQ